MSDTLTREYAARGEAVRAALARAANPTVFETSYMPAKTARRNADYGWQEYRQLRPLCAIGFNLDWLKYQLTRRGYARYFKHVINKWWTRRPRRTKRNHHFRRQTHGKRIKQLGPFTNRDPSGP